MRHIDGLRAPVSAQIFRVIHSRVFATADAGTSCDVRRAVEAAPVPGSAAASRMTSASLLRMGAMALLLWIGMPTPGQAVDGGVASIEYGLTGEESGTLWLNLAATGAFSGGPRPLGYFSAAPKQVTLCRDAACQATRVGNPSADTASCMGIAGPGGGTDKKPVGTVFMALACEGETVVVRRQNPWERATFKQVTSQQALDLLRRALESPASLE